MTAENKPDDRSHSEIPEAPNPDDPGTASNPMADASLREQLEAAKAERDANHDRWVRTVAEFENYRKRAQRESEQERQYQAYAVLRDLLPGLDNLQRAIAAAETSKNADELVRGVQMVAKQFEEVLARYSARPIDAVGKPFDPNLHEALTQIPSADHPPMTVLQEVEKGYTLHDRVLRPSKVIVSTAPSSGGD